MARSKESIQRNDARTPREKQYEEEIQYLKARVAYYESLESMQRFLKKLTTRELKYRAIMNIELEHPIWLLCEIAQVRRSSYYRYKNKPVKKDTELEEKIIQIYNKSNKRAGYRTITLLLKNNYNLIVNHKKCIES